MITIRVQRSDNTLLTEEFRISEAQLAWIEKQISAGIQVVECEYIRDSGTQGKVTFPARFFKGVKE